MLYVGSSPISLAALFSDELDVLAGGGTAAPTAYLQGFRDLALFSTLDHRFAFKIFTVPSIVDVAGLRGKRYGVTRFGGSLDFASRYFLKTPDWTRSAIFSSFKSATPRIFWRHGERHGRCRNSDVSL